MSTYRMGAGSAFPRMPRTVAWLAFTGCGDGMMDEAVFVFAASDRGARAKGARQIGAAFEEIRTKRVAALDDLDPSDYSDRDVIERGCGVSCRCGWLAYDYHEPEFDERGAIVSCSECRDDEEVTT